MTPVDPGRRRLLGTAAAVGLGVPACSARSRRSARPTRRGAIRTISYGSRRDQVGDLYLPQSGSSASLPVVILVHGGFWRVEYGRELMAGLARDVAERGWAAWNVEYRRVGQPGGGWPGTFTDVAAGIDRVATADSQPLGLDRRRVVVVGHSAGGQLAVWAAGRRARSVDSVGGAPAVAPVAAVSQAGVLDLVAGAGEGLGAGAVADLMDGSPADVPERYRQGSPVARVPIGVPVRCVHGRGDEVVPLSQSERYVATAGQAGDTATLASFDGGHFEVLDPSHESWTTAADWMGGLLDG